MNYRLILSVLLLFGILVVPVSAGLKKINVGATVFTGETGLDISFALNGCKIIAWWPAGNDTSTPPGKIIDINDALYNYSLDPALFSGYEGTWYSWDKKPNIKVFDVEKPRFILKVWDINNDRDVSGQTVPRSTKVTYRIETNLFNAFNSHFRPDWNSLDYTYDVRLNGPNGKGITNIYTGSAGLPDTQILTFDKKPEIRTSPYIWKDGIRWNHSARSGDGTPLYPLGTYTFTASQNLNNMTFYYGDPVGVTTSGPVNITFIADAPTPIPTTTVMTVPPKTTTRLITTTMTVVTMKPVITTPTLKPTWTSAPLPWELPLCALGAVSFAFLWKRKH